MQYKKLRKEWAIRVAVEPFTEIALAMSQVCDVITVGIDIGECFEQRFDSDSGTNSTFLIQHQTRFQITTSIISNDEVDSYVLGVKENMK